MKIAVRKHKGNTWFNINGEVKETRWYYTLAVRRFGFWWMHLRLFFTGTNRFSKRGVVNTILEDERVTFAYSPSRFATWFESEDDAIRVKHDIIQHPDKYITRQY